MDQINLTRFISTDRINICHNTIWGKLHTFNRVGHKIFCNGIKPVSYTHLGVCQCSKGCVDKDDTNPTIDKIAAADMILFATPVYWWGMSAQLKLIIDKCYCRGLQLKNKKVGTIVVGGSPVDSIQYELIDKQFDCMEMCIRDRL